MKITEREFKIEKKGRGWVLMIASGLGSENGENNEKRGQEEGEGGEDLSPN